MRGVRLKAWVSDVLASQWAICVTAFHVRPGESRGTKIDSKGAWTGLVHALVMVLRVDVVYPAVESSFGGARLLIARGIRALEAPEGRAT